MGFSFALSSSWNKGPYANCPSLGTRLQTDTPTAYQSPLPSYETPNKLMTAHTALRHGRSQPLVYGPQQSLVAAYSKSSAIYSTKVMPAACTTPNALPSIRPPAKPCGRLLQVLRPCTQPKSCLPHALRQTPSLVYGPQQSLVAAYPKSCGRLLNQSRASLYALPKHPP